MTHLCICARLCILVTEPAQGKEQAVLSHACRHTTGMLEEETGDQEITLGSRRPTARGEEAGRKASHSPNGRVAVSGPGFLFLKKT